MYFTIEYIHRICLERFAYILFYYLFTVNTIQITDICRNIRDAAHIKEIRSYGYPDNW